MKCVGISGKKAKMRMQTRPSSQCAPGAQKMQFFQLSFIFLRTVAPKLKKLESHTISHFKAL